jgi:hypothetical protein
MQLETVIGYSSLTSSSYLLTDEPSSVPSIKGYRQVLSGRFARSHGITHNPLIKQVIAATATRLRSATAEIFPIVLLIQLQSFLCNEIKRIFLCRLDGGSVVEDVT